MFKKRIISEILEKLVYRIRIHSKSPQICFFGKRVEGKEFGGSFLYFTEKKSVCVCVCACVMGANFLNTRSQHRDSEWL